ncbi:unnamed protein product [Hymenolepis diminuta]|uniref:Uncharacterized protein n=1 Tax=Hymenolepis diminuta TaxID=6216 RepID=A0A564Y0W8_HYMDI|nr:unnamed protein product [Hymenolepis diminuta]
MVEAAIDFANTSKTIINCENFTRLYLLAHNLDGKILIGRQISYERVLIALIEMRFGQWEMPSGSLYSEDREPLVKTSFIIYVALHINAINPTETYSPSFLTTLRTHPVCNYRKINDYKYIHH